MFRWLCCELPMLNWQLHFPGTLKCIWIFHMVNIDFLIFSASHAGINNTILLQFNSNVTPIYFASDIHLIRSSHASNHTCTVFSEAVDLGLLSGCVNGLTTSNGSFCSGGFVVKGIWSSLRWLIKVWDLAWSRDLCTASRSPKFVVWCPKQNT